MAVSADGMRIASGGADGTVKLWYGTDGKSPPTRGALPEGTLLATLVQLAPQTGKWLIITGSGYVTTSCPDAFRLEARGLQSTPENVLMVLHDPEVVQKVMSGANVAPAAVK